MSQHNETPQPGEVPSPNGGTRPESAAQGNPPASADLQKECERLKEEVRRLEQERDDYRNMMNAWAKKYFLETGPQPTPEELRRLIDEAAAMPPDDFLAEIEQLAKGQ